MTSSNRKLAPQFEHDLIRDPRLGYEPPSPSEFVRCIEHGSPTPLERWHCHDEYELQLIVGARGRAFVGDYVGHFEPGHLVLTGPRLPHNWISTDLPPNGLDVRSLVLQFREEPLRDGMRAIKELEETRPLLDRARRGIEFFGLSDGVRYFSKATDSTFTAFVNRVRIHKACQLLMHSENQIAAICYAVGFNNVANFNRRFREAKGATPREYRRQAMERLGASNPGPN